MQTITARLHVVENAVLCPRTAEWTSPEHCRNCEFVQEVGMHSDGPAVICSPEIPSYERALEAIVRA